MYLLVKALQLIYFLNKLIMVVQLQLQIKKLRDILCPQIKQLI